ncbi:ATP-binding cassette domain-containing protein [Nonomuraea sp. NPDC003707]
MSPAGVGLRGVGRTFGSGQTVLRDVDLNVLPGEIVAIFGPSGCGKSTLLRLVAGLDTPTAGRVLVDGRAATGVDERCAVVFQEPRLLPWRDLAGNVALGLPKGTDRASGREIVRHWLDVVGLEGFHRHRPRQVSGGMAQRAAEAKLSPEVATLVLKERTKVDVSPVPGAEQRAVLERILPTLVQESQVRSEAEAKAARPAWRWGRPSACTRRSEPCWHPASRPCGPSRRWPGSPSWCSGWASRRARRSCWWR